MPVRSSRAAAGGVLRIGPPGATARARPCQIMGPVGLGWAGRGVRVLQQVIAMCLCREEEIRVHGWRLYVCLNLSME